MDKDAIPYEHARFKPGEWVYIDESIREIHKKSPCAGKTLQVKNGWYYALLESHQRTMVPVYCEEHPEIENPMHIWYIEEKYVYMAISKEGEITFKVGE